MKNTDVKIKRPKRADIRPGLIVKANQANKTFPGESKMTNPYPWNLGFSAITYDPKMANKCYLPEKVDGVLTYWSCTRIEVEDGELIHLCSYVLKVGRQQYVKARLPRLYGDQEFLIFYNEIKNLTELI